MFLIVFVSGRAIQVNENLTSVDIVSATYGTSSIFRIKGEKITKLVIDKTETGVKMAWVDVPEGNVLHCLQGSVHN